MGLFDLLAGLADIGGALGEVGEEIVAEALDAALSTMESMIVNAGQDSVYNSYVADAFETNAQAPVDNGWEDVDIGEYMDFMGDIVSEGNAIMQQAYDIAQEVESDLLDAFNELQDILDEFGDAAEEGMDFDF